jgi:hypothetical protein
MPDQPADGDEPVRPFDRIEIVQVVVLALVAIATAWSGYQATQWGGRQALLYGQASTTRFAADAASTRGGQILVADSSMFTAWLQARAAGDTRLQTVLVGRFSLEYRTAFVAWLRTDPFTDPSAPPGPGYMPGFSQADLERADALNDQASALFAEGTDARETANKYVRDTVVFATVLFLIAIAQRFKERRIRIGANALALGLLAYSLISVVILPRA